MSRALACLVFASLVLSFGLLQTGTAVAQSGIRHSPSSTKVVRVFPGRHAVGHRIRFRHHIGRPLNHHKVRWAVPHRHRHGFFAHRHRHGLGFFPFESLAWPYVETADDQVPLIVEPSPPREPNSALSGIPSVADLSVSTGIRNAPAGSPTFYVLNGRQTSLRRGGAKVLNMDKSEPEAESQNAGPRIIHLNVARGR